MLMMKIALIFVVIFLSILRIIASIGLLDFHMIRVMLMVYVRKMRRTRMMIINIVNSVLSSLHNVNVRKVNLNLFFFSKKKK